MNRQELLKEYTCHAGTIAIKELGKFEGEMLFAPYFYEYANEGEVLSYMEDGCGEFVSLIEVTDDDRKEFPELDQPYVLLTENDQGFVCVTEISAKQADEARAEYAPEEEESITDEA